MDEIEEKGNFEERVVLLNLCHGGLPVNYTHEKTTDHFTYVTTRAPSNLYRLIKSPTAICCVSTDQDQQTYLNIVSDMCKEDEEDEDEFMNQCRRRLIRASRDLISEEIPSIPVKTRRTEIVEQFGEYTQPISKCTNTFEYVKSPKGQIIKNKNWSLDDYSGIIIMTNVTFELPYVPSGILSLEMLDMGNIIYDGKSDGSPYPQEMFAHQIGLVLIIDGKYYITYTQNTNVLTCPYFIEYFIKYLSHYYGIKNIEYLVEKYLNIYYSITFSPHKLVTPNKINADMLYNYFQHVAKIIQIDMSCEAITLGDPRDKLTEEEISDIFSVQTDAKRKKILKGYDSNNNNSGRGITSKNKRNINKNKNKRIKSRQTKQKKSQTKQKKSQTKQNKSRKNHKS
jgi:hypothetical protein